MPALHLTSRTLALAAALCGSGCGASDDRTASFGFIAPVVLAPNCATASCHSRAVAEAGIDLSEPDVAYRSLLQLKAQVFVPEPPVPGDPTCRAARGGSLCTTTRPLVLPCHPDQSRLINLLYGRGAQRMPPDRALPIADIRLIEQWILSGARRAPSDREPSCEHAVLPDAQVFDASAHDAAALDTGMGVDVAMDMDTREGLSADGPGDAATLDGGTN